ncbi:hypothetical protein L1987_30075 [Smallanthus sonchifolius]|uniref:Uncharacterized protein n=1 Tax=Smallanthus sonchifolius TaxID=185202 RepID=A0ACB9I3B7_9ASTR|nr:hypothetical protein L1987_30075 [Smallanthus sonchifolius]
MMFKDKLGDTMEGYIDDMVVKSKKAKDHPGDLKEALDILDHYNMKLNPSKCHFGVGAGKFLGYMVTKTGIEASPKQIKAIINLKSPANTKDPELSGRMAKWSVKLSTYDLKYEPRTVTKSQALADFVADFSSICLGIILKLPQGDILPQSISCEFQATNNEAEYEALIAGLQLACDMKIREILPYPTGDGGVSDSSEGSVSLTSDGSGCCSYESPSVATGNDDAMRMMFSSSEEGGMNNVNMTAMHCMSGCYVYHDPHTHENEIKEVFDYHNGVRIDDDRVNEVPADAFDFLRF